MNIDLNPEVSAKAIVAEVGRKNPLNEAEKKRLTDFIVSTLKGHTTDPVAKKESASKGHEPVTLKAHEQVTVKAHEKEDK